MIASDTDSHLRLHHRRCSRACIALFLNSLKEPYRIHLPGDRPLRCRTSQCWLSPGAKTVEVAEAGVVERQAYCVVLLSCKLPGPPSDELLSVQGLISVVGYIGWGQTSCEIPRMLERMLRSSGTVRALRFAYRPSFREFISPACKNVVDVKIVKAPAKVVRTLAIP